MAIAVPFAKPLRQGEGWLQRVNVKYWLARAPMVILAIPAAWGVGSFAHEKLPLLIAVFAGMGFECAYIGAVALADQQHDSKDKVSNRLWWALNIMAVASSIVTNTLFFSGGKYANITPESVTHGAPLALLAFMYGLVLHRNAVKQSAQEYCEVCKQTFANRNSFNGHKRTCKP